jgi:hypothetical protein
MDIHAAGLEQTDASPHPLVVEYARRRGYRTFKLNFFLYHIFSRYRVQKPTIAMHINFSAWLRNDNEARCLEFRMVITIFKCRLNCKLRAVAVAAADMKTLN